MCPDLDLTHSIMKYGIYYEAQFEQENYLKYRSRKPCREAPVVYNHLVILNPKFPTLSSLNVPALQKIHFSIFTTVVDTVPDPLESALIWLS
jgi:hypothetical protein